MYKVTFTHVSSTTFGFRMGTRKEHSPVFSKVNLIKLILKMAHLYLSLCQEPGNESLLVVSRKKKKERKEKQQSQFAGANFAKVFSIGSSYSPPGICGSKSSPRRVQTEDRYCTAGTTPREIAQEKE